MSNPILEKSTIVATLTARLVTLRTETRTDYVLGWDHGLAVAIVNGKPVVVSAELADTCTKALVDLKLHNGARVAARPIKRSVLIRTDITGINRALEMLANA